MQAVITEIKNKAIELGYPTVVDNCDDATNSDKRTCFKTKIYN